MELTANEIEDVIKKSKSSLLNIPGVISSFANRRLDILSISPLNGLIFIKGDAETGFEHIQYRHNNFSLPKLTPNLSGKYITPSKFPRDSNPLLDYVRIADKLYNSDNLVLNNSNSAKFDLYSNKLSDEQNRKFILILYKGTKIVHTLYTKLKFKELEYTRAPLRIISNNLVSVSFSIPFIDKDSRLKYSIHVEINAGSCIETLRLLIFENGKLTQSHIPLGERKINIATYDDMVFRMNSYEYADLTQFEKIISTYEKGQIQ